jgi:hypothetical protein
LTSNWISVLGLGVVEGAEEELGTVVVLDGVGPGVGVIVVTGAEVVEGSVVGVVTAGVVVTTSVVEVLELDVLTGVVLWA